MGAPDSSHHGRELRNNSGVERMKSLWKKQTRPISMFRIGFVATSIGPSEIILCPDNKWRAANGEIFTPNILYDIWEDADFASKELRKDNPISLWERFKAWFNGEL